MKIFKKATAILLLSIVGAFMVSCGGGSDDVDAVVDEDENPMEQLASKGFSFSIEEYHRSAREGDLQAVKLFHQAGMELESALPTGETALFFAAQNGQSEVASHLIERGADINTMGPEGLTLLLAAAEKGHAEVVEVLLEAGSDPTVEDVNAWTPLTKAAFEGQAEAVRVLAPHSRDKLDAALHLASVNGDTETIDVLLNSGASVFARSNENKTALMYAASNGNEDAVRVLLQNDSNRFAIDNYGNTSAQLAQAHGHAEVADFLLEPPTIEERSMPENPTFADITPQQDEFTADNVEDIDSFNRVDNSSGDYIPSSRQPAPQRIEGAVVLTSKREVVTPTSTEPTEAHASLPKAKLTKDNLASVANKLRMHDYRESQLPVMLDDVEGDTATVRVLYGDGEAVSVKSGGRIGETGLEVVNVKRRFISSKQGKGNMVNVSEILIRNIRTGEKTLVIKDVPAKSNDTYALMSIEDGDTLYDVRRDDQFTTEVPGHGRVNFRVVDIRPTQVILEEPETGQTFTIKRASFGF